MLGKGRGLVLRVACALWGLWSEEPGLTSTWDAFSGQWEENTGLILLCMTKV